MIVGDVLMVPLFTMQIARTGTWGQHKYCSTGVDQYVQVF